MKTACFIPIKENSERIQGKNLKILNGKELYKYIIEHAIESNVFDDIFVDTNSKSIMDFCRSKEVRIIERLEELSKNTANGNDLLNYHYTLYPDYDCYFQLFATAPFLQVKSIVDCYDKLVNSNQYDSCFTAFENHGFFWLNGNPVNYRPEVLPRSQDLVPLVEETTGLYGIKREALEKYHCRIGEHPYVKIINKFEAVDINTEEDFKLAEYIGINYWGNNKNV